MSHTPFRIITLVGRAFVVSKKNGNDNKLTNPRQTTKMVVKDERALNRNICGSPLRANPNREVTVVILGSSLQSAGARAVCEST